MPSPAVLAWAAVVSVVIGFIGLYLTIAQARGLPPWNSEPHAAPPTTPASGSGGTSEPQSNGSPPPVIDTSAPAPTSAAPQATFDVPLEALAGDPGYSATVGQQL